MKAVAACRQSGDDFTMHEGLEAQGATRVLLMRTTFEVAARQGIDGCNAR